MPDQTFGARLVALRKAAELTQTALAALVGVSQVQISLIESGQREPSVGTLRKLAKALGVSPGRLFGEETK